MADLDMFKGMEERIATLEAENAKYKLEVTNLRGIVSDQDEDLATERARSARLAGALREYGDHLSCKTEVGLPCSCGFEDALADTPTAPLVTPEVREAIRVVAGRLDGLLDHLAYTKHANYWTAQVECAFTTLRAAGLLEPTP